MPVQHLPRLAPAQTTPRPRADAAGSLGKVHQPPPALVRALADGAVALGTDPLPAALVVCEPLLGQPVKAGTKCPKTVGAKFPKNAGLKNPQPQLSSCIGAGGGKRLSTPAFRFSFRR